MSEKKKTVKKTYLKLDDQHESNVDENLSPDYKSLLYLLKFSSKLNGKSSCHWFCWSQLRLL